MLKQKKAQAEFPIAVFVIFFIALLFLAPTMIKLVGSTLTPLGNSFAAISPQANATAMYAVEYTNNFWDTIVVLVFVMLTIVLFISAYFVDVSPVFAVVYVVIGFIFFLIAPSLQDVLTNLYTNPNFVSEVAHAPMSEFLTNHFGIILFVIYIIAGIVMYGKMRTATGAQL